jgi:PAS domain S-box-containing protein
MKFFSSFFPKIIEYPLSYRLVVYVVLISSLFALLSTATQLYFDYRRDISTLYESLSFIQKSYLQTFAASTFKIDTRQLELQLEGALKLPDIVYLEIRELRGDQVHTHSKGNPTAPQIIRREFPLEYISASGEKSLIGTLVVDASLEGVYQRLMSRVLTILVTNIIKTFLASACILAIIYYLMTRHLRQMASYTQKLIPGLQNRLLALNRKPRKTDKPDELDHVVNAINDLEERVAADIIRQKQAELKYRTVADFTYDWEYWANLDGKLNYVSPSCERISGYAVKEFIENPSLFREIIVPEDRGIWDQHYPNSREEFRQRELQFRIKRRDGEIRWIEHVCQPVNDDQGKPLGFRASNRDVTKRKQSEFDLQKSYSEIEQFKNQLEAESAYLQEEIKVDHSYEKIIGQSDALKYVLFKVEQVAATDTTVLILGETGTGKELIARAIHNTSQYNHRPLVKVNCAVLPANLIENELFGHEKGAFTGADSRHVGRFELANGTTLFLDEIGELTPDLQTKLLRVLQDGEFERLGSSKTIKVDVRVIAATNRNLEAEMRRGRFREDLYYRLNVFPITVPPLRNRSDDIPLLVRFFVDEFSKRQGKIIEVIPKRVIEILKDYHWPGNVRELEHVIERAVIHTSGPKLRLVDEFNQTPQSMPSALRTMAAVEAEHITRVLEKTDWQISGMGGAAEILGLKRGTLRARMQKLGIRKP